MTLPILCLCVIVSQSSETRTTGVTDTLSSFENSTETTANVTSISSYSTEQVASLRPGSSDSHSIISTGDHHSNVTSTTAHTPWTQSSGSTGQLTTAEVPANFLKLMPFPISSDFFYDDVDTAVVNRSVEDMLLSGLCKQNDACRSDGSLNRMNQTQSWFETDHNSTSRVQSCFTLECFPCLCQPCTMGLCCPQDLTEAAEDTGQFTGCITNGFVAIVRCPKDGILTHGVANACEVDTSGGLTVENPVTDLETNTTYRNKHCAECHGVTDYVSWEKLVRCQHFQFVYTAESEEELIEKASQTTMGYISTCSVKPIPPATVIPYRCSDLGWYPQALVTSCNVTGRWEHFDATVAKNCQQYKAMSLRVRTRDRWTNLVFQNVYCAECNGFPPRPVSCWQIGDSDFVWPGVVRPTAPLTLLLGLRDHDEEEPLGWKDYLNDDSNGCSSDGWIDFDVSLLCQFLALLLMKVFNLRFFFLVSFLFLFFFVFLGGGCCCCCCCCRVFFFSMIIIIISCFVIFLFFFPTSSPHYFSVCFNYIVFFIFCIHVVQSAVI